ncbi:f-box/lrr-repeat protein [Quercus suber]|uniref:F-box/lrr-repeat protein n=1 Tax=Quercus suber TaxID=58331 RepID=A0AAW0KGF0_QUESU
MRNQGSSDRSWNNMDYNILVKIFMTLNFMDIISSVSLVCSSWRSACCDPALWTKLDLSTLSPDSNDVLSKKYTLSNDESGILTKILKSALNLSRGNVTCLVFNYFISINDEHLVCASERSPNLKRLILPLNWHQLTESGIQQSFKMWEALESLTVPSVIAPFKIMEAIGSYCKSFSELKLQCFFNLNFAVPLTKNVPKLKVLSLRGTMVHNQAMIFILDNFKHLEVLNMCHCQMKEVYQYEVGFTLYREIDPPIIEKSSRLKKFLTCQRDTCNMCKWRPYNERVLDWAEFELKCWREDEVSSLAHGPENC